MPQHYDPEFLVEIIGVERLSGKKKGISPIYLTSEGQSYILPSMPRTPRLAPGGMIFHILNRGNARAQIFRKEADYLAFEKAMAETTEHVPMRILAYLSDAQSLALGSLAEERRRARTVYATTDHHARASLAPTSAQRRQRAPVPRPLQVVSDRV